MEITESVVLVLITASATIMASVAAQMVVNKQKRNDYLKEKCWDGLHGLVESLSEVGNHLDNALNPWDDTKVDFELLHRSFESMLRAQSYVYMTGRKDLITNYVQLYENLEFIEKHSSNKTWEVNVRMRYNQLPSKAVAMIMSISRFMSS